MNTPSAAVPAEYQSLLEVARDARERAYAPYSGFAVGAAVLTDDGTAVPGCNVESVSYGLTQCAERTAIASAIAQGHRGFQALALVTDGPLRTPCCGACRQWLAEHLPPDAPVLKVTPEGVGLWRVEDLLPDPFLRIPGRAEASDRDSGSGTLHGLAANAREAGRRLDATVRTFSVPSGFFHTSV